MRAPGRRSKLQPYAEAIRNLARDQYGLPQIQEFLRLNGVEVSATTIARFIERTAAPGGASRDA